MFCAKFTESMHCMTTIKVYIMCVPVMENRNSVPWTTLNISPQQTILDIKQQIIKTELFHNIDIQSIDLYSSDSKVIFTNNSTIDKYPSYIKNKCDINAFCFNYFGNGWPTAKPFLSETKVSKCIQLKLYNEKTEQQYMGYFTMNYINNSRHVLAAQIQELTDILPKYQMFIANNENKSLSIDDQWNISNTNVTVYPSNKFITHKEYKAAVHFTKCTLNTITKDSMQIGWNNDVSIIIVQYLWGINSTTWKHYICSENIPTCVENKMQYLYPYTTAQELLYALGLGGKHSMLLNKYNGENVSNKTMYQLGLWRNDWKYKFYDKYKVHHLLPNGFPTTISNGWHRLYTVCITGKTISMDYNGNETIWEFKCRMQDKEGVPPKQSRIIYKGVELENVRTFRSYNISPESTVYFVVRLRG
eukprot:164383_1